MTVADFTKQNNSEKLLNMKTELKSTNTVLTLIKFQIWYFCEKHRRFVILVLDY